jgi:hypothetical protein
MSLVPKLISGALSRAKGRLWYALLCHMSNREGVDHHGETEVLRTHPCTVPRGVCW